MSYRDDSNYIRERKIEKLLKERALLSAYPVANHSKIKAIDALLDSLQSEALDEKIYEEDLLEEPRTSFKEKISNSFGAFGAVLYFIVRMIISVLPFVMIGGNFFLTLILISINTFVPSMHILMYDGIF